MYAGKCGTIGLFPRRLVILSVYSIIYSYGPLGTLYTYNHYCKKIVIYEKCNCKKISDSLIDPHR